MLLVLSSHGQYNHQSRITFGLDLVVTRVSRRRTRRPPIQLANMYECRSRRRRERQQEPRGISCMYLSSAASIRGRVSGPSMSVPVSKPCNTPHHRSQVCTPFLVFRTPLTSVNLAITHLSVQSLDRSMHYLRSGNPSAVRDGGFVLPDCRYLSYCHSHVAQLLNVEALIRYGVANARGDTVAEA